MPRRYINALGPYKAMAMAAILPREERDRLLREHREALDDLLTGGERAEQGWHRLAGLVGVVLAMSEQGIGRGDQATQVMEDATASLSWLWTRHESIGTWAMQAADREQLRERCGWLLDLYAVQLNAASAAEYTRAHHKAIARIAGAQAGNAPKGAEVIG